MAKGLTDKAILAITHDLVHRFTRLQYEELLTEVGLYSLSELREEMGQYRGLSKRELVLTTVEETRDRWLINSFIDHLATRRFLNPETLALIGATRTPKPSLESPSMEPASDRSRPKGRTPKRSMKRRGKTTSSPRPAEAPVQAQAASIGNLVVINPPPPGGTPPSHPSPSGDSSLSRLVLPGVIGAIALIIVAIIGYFGIKYQVEKPIHATETAEARATQLAPTKLPPPTVTSGIPALAPTSTLQSTPIAVGVVQIESYLYTDIMTRLQSLGLRAEWIPPQADYYTLRDFNVIYLPTGWAYASAVIAENQSAYWTFLEKGGGLLVEQPNSREDFTPSLLPYPVTFRLVEAPEADWPPVIANGDHFITRDLSEDDAPGAVNEITSISKEYEVLCRSRSSSYPTLAVAQYSSGRIAILAASASPQIKPGFSDAVYLRVFQWLARLAD